MNAPVRSFEVTKRVPFSPSYCVSESGKVGRIGKTDWLKPVPAKRGGYLQVGLWEGGVGKVCYVHQLVAIAFIGPRPSPKHDCAHNDGDKTNNHWRNLRWATRSENERDKILHGTSNHGERNGSAKITDAQAVEIKDRAKALPRSRGGVRIKKGALSKLAAEYGLTTGGARLIINGYRRSAT